MNAVVVLTLAAIPLFLAVFPIDMVHPLQVSRTQAVDRAAEPHERQPSASSPAASGTLGDPHWGSSERLARDHFVQADGTHLQVQGRRFRFVGFNIFDAAGTPSGYHCAWWPPYSDEDLDATLGYLRAASGVSVIRFWAFQSYTRGGTDWRGIDRVIRLARTHGMRVIPVLENGSEHCTQGGTKWVGGGRWYSQAIRREVQYGYPLSFPAYVERIVSRYRDEPTILGWMVMNEAEAESVTSLYEFAREMTTLIKQLAPNHLVTLGTQSTGQPGGRGAEFRRLYELPSMDFVAGHDYPSWLEDTRPLPGSADGQRLPDPTRCDNYRALACSISVTLRTINKPFVITEAGLRLRAPGLSAGFRRGYSVQERAEILDAKISAAFAVGVSGYLIWQWNTVVDQGYDILADDPLLPVLRRHADSFQRSRPAFRP